MDAIKAKTDVELIAKIEQYTDFMNVKYAQLKGKWVGYEWNMFYAAIVCAVNLVFFHQYANFSESEY